MIVGTAVPTILVRTIVPTIVARTKISLGAVPTALVETADIPIKCSNSVSGNKNSLVFPSTTFVGTVAPTNTLNLNFFYHGC